MIELYEAQYCHELSCGGDPWRIYGRVFGHEDIKDGTYMYPSTPKSFDETTLIFTTASGRLYKIMSFHMDKDKFIEQIKKDILNGGFEIH